MSINISTLGQLFLGLYLLLTGLVYATDLTPATWVLPVCALIAGIAILVGIVTDHISLKE